jgi:hypothetical protein
VKAKAHRHLRVFLCRLTLLLFGALAAAAPAGCGNDAAPSAQTAPPVVAAAAPAALAPAPAPAPAASPRTFTTPDGHVLIDADTTRVMTLTRNPDGTFRRSCGPNTDATRAIFNQMRARRVVK